MESFKDVWDSALLIIRERISETSYNTWIKPLKPMKFDNKYLT